MPIKIPKRKNSSRIETNRINILSSGLMATSQTQLDAANICDSRVIWMKECGEREGGIKWKKARLCYSHVYNLHLFLYKYNSIFFSLNSIEQEAECYLLRKVFHELYLFAHIHEQCLYVFEVAYELFSLLFKCECPVSLWKCRFGHCSCVQKVCEILIHSKELA